MGGPWRAAKAAPELWAGTPTCTVPLTLIGVGVAVKQPPKGSIAMTPRHPLTLAPPSRRARANRHRRLALAALKLNSSLSIRLNRYRAHIAIARHLEASGVQP